MADGCEGLSGPSSFELDDPDRCNEFLAFAKSVPAFPNPLLLRFFSPGVSWEFLGMFKLGLRPGEVGRSSSTESRSRPLGILPGPELVF